MTATMIKTPERSLEQRMEALKKANDTRSHRKQVKADLRAGRQAVVPLVVHPPAELETMKVVDLLLAIPKVGRVKANKMLSRQRISPSKTFGGLTERQRRELAAVLRGAQL